MYMSLTNNGTLIITNKFFVPRSTFPRVCWNQHIFLYMCMYPYIKIHDLLKRWHSSTYTLFIYCSFTGWEVRIGRNCARDLEYRHSRPRARFLPIRTDPGRWVTCLFFSYWDLNVLRKFSFTSQPICVEVGRVRVVEGRDRLQTKTKHYNMTFSSVIYIMAPTALF